MRDQEQEHPEQQEAGRGVRVAMAAAGLGHAVWGMSYLFSRIALQIAGTDILLSMRFLLAVLLMTVMILLGKARVSFRGKNWKPLLLLAATELGCFFFESYGILYTNATFAGVVSAVSPVVAVGLAILFLREYPSRRQAVFCLLPVIGVIVMTVSGNSLGIVRPIGVVCMICTCVLSAAYKTANRKAAEEFSPFERTYVVLLACAAVFTLSALLRVGGDWKAYFAPLAEPSFCVSLVVLSVLSSVAANMLINYAAGKISVTQLTSLGSLTTLCSMFAGVIFLKEPMSAGLLFGAVLILVGIRQVIKK